MFADVTKIIEKKTGQVRADEDADVLYEPQVENCRSVNHHNVWLGNVKSVLTLENTGEETP